jgi:periplasmic protein TonB
MLSRVFISTGLGILTAFALLWVMQALVTVTGELRESSGRLSVDYVRLRRDTTPDLKKREPPKREKPKQAPPPPEMNVAKAMRPGDAVGAIIPMVDTAVELGKATALGAGGADRDVVPLVRVDPDYPPRAKARGIEGYVDVQFTITPVGTVEDPVVIGANPSVVFDQAALRAIRKWKYQPKIQNGVPVARPGQKVRIRFEL